jgi:hypothetical protein
MEDINLSHTFNLQVDNGNIPYLNEAAKWGKFLSILGFVLIIILVICGCVFLFSGGNLASDVNTDLPNLDLAPGAFGIVFAIYFFITALIYFFPCFFMYRFAAQMQLALRTNDQIVLNRSFENLKSLFKFFGVVTIIILCIWVIAAIFGAVLGSIF